MTIEPTITCPSCATRIKLTDGLAAPLLAATRKDYEARLAAQAADAARRETELAAEQADLTRARAEVQAQITAQVDAARAQLLAEARDKARVEAAANLDAKAAELAEMRAVLDANTAKLADAQTAQAEALRLQRMLADEKRQLDLTIEQRVLAENEKVRATARAEAETALGLKLSERDLQIATMTRTIDELKRKSEQGSQQLQGEVLELALEDTLRARFPTDSIEPVAKGQSGADALQRVISPVGAACGAILWETKRTKAWSDGWLTKLREDQRSARADVAVLVSTALPRDIDSFGQIDGVWVTAPKYMIPLALTLRAALIDLALARGAVAGQQTKTELLYGYLTGPRFRHRVQAIVEKWEALQDDLNKERKFLLKQWAKRDAEIQGAIAATIGIYGDVQGIAGQVMPDIEGLEVPQLPDGTAIRPEADP